MKTQYPFRRAVGRPLLYALVFLCYIGAAIEWVVDAFANWLEDSSERLEAWMVGRKPEAKFVDVTGLPERE